LQRAAEGCAWLKHMVDGGGIDRILGRWGVLDRVHRVRRPPPPRGWYLPAVAEGEAELDCLDFSEDLKLAINTVRPLLSLSLVTRLNS